MLHKIKTCLPALLGFLAIATPSFAVMDFTGVTVDYESALAAALLVVAGYAAVWGIKLVVSVFKR